MTEIRRMAIIGIALRPQRAHPVDLNAGSSISTLVSINDPQ